MGTCSRSSLDGSGHVLFAARNWSRPRGLDLRDADRVIHLLDDELGIPLQSAEAAQS
jgi:hypothetical protein